MLEVVVVGAGAAGLSAALVLGRARRHTLVLDGGPPRNAPSPSAHGCFTRDGTLPSELLRIGRAQLAPYETVRVRPGVVSAIRENDGAFTLDLADGMRVEALRVLLATGVRDVLPDVPGLAELWGRSVLHCPYCHGWEVRDEPLALYATGRSAMEMAPLLLQWSPHVLLVTGGLGELAEADRETLRRLGVVIVDTPVRRLQGDGEHVKIHFADGGQVTLRALFVRPTQEVSTDLHRQLGCESDEGFIRVGDDQQTTVRGVYAAGDAAKAMQQIVVAAASGAQAAAAINRDLVSARTAASSATVRVAGAGATVEAHEWMDSAPTVPDVTRDG